MRPIRCWFGHDWLREPHDEEATETRTLPIIRLTIDMAKFGLRPRPPKDDA
jgi:hypothetical protein